MVRGDGKEGERDKGEEIGGKGQGTREKEEEAMVPMLSGLPGGGEFD